MKLQPQHVARLEQFFERISRETYPEPPTELHGHITLQMLDRLAKRCPLNSGLKVLDVGCGQGVALAQFLARGCDPVGIALNPLDVAACRRQGFRVLEMEQSFLDFEDEAFDVIWCRHCLEHSIFPYFTPSQFARVLRSEGWLYVEVPAPDTACRHQANRNHYSVLGKSMWSELFARCGFRIVEEVDINFTVAAGPDTYWAFLLQKEA